MSEAIQTPEIGTEEVVTPAVTEKETPQIPTEQVEAPAETPEPVEPEPAADPDYKTKFVESQKEAILLNERNKVKEAQIEQLTKTDTPTDEAMRLVYPEWDDLNEVTKKAFIKQETQEMRQNQLFAQQQEIINRQKLEDELGSVDLTTNYLSQTRVLAKCTKLK